MLSRKLLSENRITGPYVVSTSYGFQTSTSTSINVSKPTGTANGDLLFAIISGSGTAVFTPAAGWTAGTNVSATAMAYRTAWKAAGGSEPSSYTFTSDTSRILQMVLICMRYSIHDTIATVNTGDSTGLDLPSTVIAGGLCLAAAVESASAQVWTAPAGWDDVFEADATAQETIKVFSKVLPSGSTGTIRLSTTTPATQRGVLYASESTI